jgi:putative membrane protein insertion efficiency factor
VGQLRRIAVRGLLAAIRLYQLTLSPWLGRACRYEPTCSVYTAEAIRTHGPAKGVYLGARRIARCHPWGGSGYDPVPPSTPRGERLDPR